MCGITAFISKHDANVISYILNSLKQLQNRGYDSIGITHFVNNDFHTCKYASTNICNSLSTLQGVMIDKVSNIGIGHTRWATHGGRTNKNAHPHTSMNDRVAIVHNGIIENYKEQKTNLIAHGYVFKSETDSEVIANLIEYILESENIDIEDAIRKACIQLEGTFGLAILFKDTPDNIYVIRNGSPMLIGENDDYYIATSEVSGFINLVQNYIIINNHDLITLGRNGYSSYNTYLCKPVQNEIMALTPDPYPHWTIKEIMEQPESLLRAINNGGRIMYNSVVLGGLSSIKDIIPSIQHIVLMGCGTSLHACQVAKYYFQIFNMYNTIQYLNASEFTPDDIPTKGRTIVIMCSQSGETKDLQRCIDLCRMMGCITIGVVNSIDSCIAREVDCGIYLNARREVAVASTKSFTSTIVVLSLISMWMHGQSNMTSMRQINMIQSLRGLSAQVDSMLTNKAFHLDIDKIVETVYQNNKTSMFLLGNGRMVAIAKEAALKIKEICYIHAEGYPAAALKHGPFALLEKGVPVFLFITKDNSEKMLNTYEEITSRNAYVIVISELTDLDVQHLISVPKTDYYQEVLFIVCMQYFAYHLSIKREIDPDKPRNLAKVVTVE